MAIREPSVAVGSEKALILDALASNVRLDGRGRDEFRQIRITLTRAECVASAEVQIGRTRVRSTVSGEIVAPFADRPSEGSITFGADISPMAMPTEETGLGFVSGSELTRVLERTIRDSNVLDTESLCIVSGDKVWAIKCDVTVTDYGGNVIDASVLAMMAAMRMFRRSEVQVTAGPRGKPIARVYHSDEKEPIPLALHHIPVCVTLGLFSTAASKGDAEYTYVVDPTEREEAALDGRISFAINAHREVCAIHKLGGLALAVDDVIRACALCAAKAAQLHEVLNLAVNEAEERAKRERAERLQRYRQGESLGTAVAGVLPGAVKQTAAHVKQSSLWDRLHEKGALAPAVAQRRAAADGGAVMGTSNKMATAATERESLKTSQMPAIDEALLDYANLHTAAHVREDDEEDLRRQAQAKSRQKLLAVPFEESKDAAKPAATPAKAKPAAKKAAATPAATATSSAGASDDLSSAIKKKKKPSKK